MRLTKDQAALMTKSITPTSPCGGSDLAFGASKCSASKRDVCKEMEMITATWQRLPQKVSWMRFVDAQMRVRSNF
jgi:hypothetical protein